MFWKIQSNAIPKVKMLEYLKFTLVFFCCYLLATYIDIVIILAEGAVLLAVCYMKYITPVWIWQGEMFQVR